MIAQPASGVGRLVLLAILLGGISACATHQPVADHQVRDDRDAAGSRTLPTLGERAAAVAMQQVGVPYRYGGNSPSGFDCSGLVHYSYARAGKPVPRTTTALWDGLPPVEPQRIRTGDLLFFNIEGKMSHVGLYVGNGRFVHAPSTGRSVTVEHLDDEYYSRALIRAGRPR